MKHLSHQTIRQFRRQNIIDIFLTIVFIIFMAILTFFIGVGIILL